eukprot:TRINITY_DN12972_c0_g1_i2.p1 TRINITY_DN12972_c0_g1~~TRINITY_DN12972_c0_g1_i2.p1  ORF type:complete len:449 (+),score=220.33 TRINITY_DN12972_c0_g1_i2:49-1347(+)
MALVEVNSVNANTGAIADIAATTKHHEQTLKDLTKEMQAIDREIGDMNKEKGLIETALMLSELQINKLRVYDRLNAAKPNPEVSAKLTDLKNKLKLEQKKGKLAEAAKQTTMVQYEKKTNRLEELRHNLEETKARTNWAVISKGSTENRDYLGQENRLKELTARLAKLEDEQRIQKQLTARKAACINELEARMAELEEAEKHLQELKEELLDNEAERNGYIDELRTLNRIYHKKECLIKDLKKDCEVNDPAMIKRLESDKKVMQYEITKHADSRRANDKTIQAQHHRLKSLETKLRAIAVALKSLKKKDITEEEIMLYRPKVVDASCEACDAALFKDVQVQLENSRRQIESKDIEMMQKDVTVEVLEKKVEILANAREVLIRKLRLESAEKEKEKRELCGAIERDEDEHNYQRDRLQSEKADYDSLVAGKMR